jgi:hypothetical protein
MTRTEIIAEIRKLAESECDGCRLSWKLQDERHSEPKPIRCEALHLRQAIIHLSH